MYVRMAGWGDNKYVRILEWGDNKFSKMSEWGDNNYVKMSRSGHYVSEYHLGWISPKFSNPRNPLNVTFPLLCHKYYIYQC